MAPETGSIPPVGRQTVRSTSRQSTVDGSNGTSASSALDALAAAREQVTPSTRRGARTAFPRLRPWWLVVVALAGTLPAFVAPVEHLSSATIRVDGSDAVKHAENYRRALLDYAWKHMSASPGTGPSIYWAVETPRPDYLALQVRCADGKRGLAAAREIGLGFVEAIRMEADHLRSTQSQSEVVLGDMAAQLKDRLQKAEAQVIAQGRSNTRTPAAEYESLTARWTSARADFQALRGELLGATVALEQLRSAGEPAHGLVSATERQKAIADDLTLQQDLKELRVNLTELKLHLLNVWKESTAPLDALTTESKALQATVGRIPAEFPANAGDAQTREDEFAGAAQSLHENITTFAAAWHKEFSQLRLLEADPMAAEIVDVHDRLRLLVNKFLFDGGRQLAKLRAEVRESDAVGEDDARHHVRQSELLNVFHTVQAAFHRFEFVAGALETRSNFHMDASLRGASGLRRRSQQHIRSIDEQLERKATEKARREYQDQVKHSQAAVNDLRSRADRLVEELVILQESLNIQAGLSAEFLRNSLLSEHADREAGLARTDLERIQQQQRVLEDQRRSTYGETELRLVDIGVVSDWMEAWRRLRVGVAGALVSVLAVMAGQWLIRRQGESAFL